jgi:hypothetical protein
LAFVFPHNNNPIVKGIRFAIVVTDSDDVEVIGFVVCFKYVIAFEFKGFVDGFESR